MRRLTQHIKSFNHFISMNFTLFLFANVFCFAYIWLRKESTIPK